METRATTLVYLSESSLRKNDRGITINLENVSASAMVNQNNTNMNAVINALPDRTRCRESRIILPTLPKARQHRDHSETRRHRRNASDDCHPPS